MLLTPRGPVFPGKIQLSVQPRYDDSPHSEGQPHVPDHSSDETDRPDADPTIPAQELSAPEEPPECPPGFEGDAGTYHEWPLEQLPSGGYTALVVEEHPAARARQFSYLLEGVLSAPQDQLLLRWSEVCDRPKV